jgi:hypothetical protein
MKMDEKGSRFIVPFYAAFIALSMSVLFFDFIFFVVEILAATNVATLSTGTSAFGSQKLVVNQALARGSATPQHRKNLSDMEAYNHHTPHIDAK